MSSPLAGYVSSQALIFTFCLFQIWFQLKRGSNLTQIDTPESGALTVRTGWSPDGIMFSRLKSGPFQLSQYCWREMHQVHWYGHEFHRKPFQDQLLLLKFFYDIELSSTGLNARFVDLSHRTWPISTDIPVNHIKDVSLIRKSNGLNKIEFWDFKNFWTDSF